MSKIIRTYLHQPSCKCRSCIQRPGRVININGFNYIFSVACQDYDDCIMCNVIIKKGKWKCNLQNSKTGKWINSTMSTVSILCGKCGVREAFKEKEKLEHTLLEIYDDFTKIREKGKDGASV